MDPMFELNGKTVLLTGASKGIGAAMAEALGRAGANVVAHYGSDRAGAEAATAAIPPDRVRLVEADLSDMQAVDRLWRDAVAWRGRIDVLVNNAAVMRQGQALEDESGDDTWDAVWDEALTVNVLAPVRLMRHAVRHYLKSGGGVLITVSSWAAQRGSSFSSLLAYASSKGAVLTATRTIARNYARQNILAYAIAPGVVRTRMSEEMAASAGGEAAVSAGLAMGEWVPPSELGALAVFLASGACRHLSGATLDVNGATYMR
jgi:NAD(P)-dependent dehydrogenase (short-subunit alcohol dehydrogenase family)